MAELLTAVTPEQRRKFYPLAVAGIGIMALTGCSQTSEEYLPKLSPEERFSYDFTYFPGTAPTVVENNFTQSHCLAMSGFNTRNDAYTTTTSYDKEADLLTVTAQTGDILELTGFTQYEHTVEPANKTSQAIFDSYGCEVENYDTE